MILAKMTGVHLHTIDNGGCYYRDDKDVCWYEFRNNLEPGYPIIVVDAKTRVIRLMYQGNDPTMVGLFQDGVYDIYQLDKFPAKSWDEYVRNVYTFVDDEVVIVDTPVPVDKPRTKEDIMRDLLKLQEELGNMSDG